MKRNWRKWWLDYFDWNQDGETNWWEYCIPVVIIIIVEVIAEMIVRWIY